MSAGSLAAAAEDEDFWAARFPDGAPVLDLPLKDSRPAVKTYRSGREILRIDEELCAALKRTGARSGATLFATIVAAYEVLLSPPGGTVRRRRRHPVRRPTSARKRCAGRPLREHRATAGDPRPRCTVRRAPPHRARDLAEAQDHSLLTFGSLVRRLNIARDPSRTPLVATTFAIDKVGAPFDFGNVSITSLRTPRSYSNFDVQMNVVDTGSDLLVECDYNVDLFTSASIRRWLSHYENLLRAVVAEPGDSVASLPLLGADELAGLGEAGAVAGAVTESFPDAGSLHERFAAVVSSGPDRVAVVCGEESLSYGELDRRANALATRLQAAGVEPNVLVGLRCERSVDVVVGVIGILKAGGAYVPLDPAYPRDRVEFMLADAGVRLVVTQSEFVPDFGPGVELVLLDRDREEAVAESGFRRRPGETSRM